MAGASRKTSFFFRLMEPRLAKSRSSSLRVGRGMEFVTGSVAPRAAGRSEEGGEVGCRRVAEGSPGAVNLLRRLAVGWSLSREAPRRARLAEGGGEVGRKGGRCVAEGEFLLLLNETLACQKPLIFVPG